MLTTSQVGSLVRVGLGEGLSANKMLTSLREAGSGIRRQSFLQLVGEVRAAGAAAGELAAAPLESQLEASRYVTWHGGATNTYLHRVSLFVRQDVEGNLEVVTKNFDILSSERLTPAEAVRQAVDIFNTNTGSENYSSEQLLGAELRGAYHQEGGG
ncbi:MAG: hypothetical protein ACRDUW_05075 [Pseudonocardiaceae bacterium]